MRVLVTDGNTLPGLAITRSLGKAGHYVIVGNCHARSMAGVSKYASDRCIYPKPDGNSVEFIDYLLEYCRKQNVDAILPVTDISTMLITENVEKFAGICDIPFCDYSTICRVADKSEMVRLAHSANVDTPKSIILGHKDDPSRNDLEMDFPVVVKPSRSRIAVGKTWKATEVTYASNPANLDEILSGYDPDIFPVIIQEKIVGPGTGVFLCLDHGKVVAAFSHRRIREKPPSGGVSVLRASAELDPLAYQFSRALLESVNWHGVAMVEFKIDNRDHRPKLMEINGRFWGSLQLAIDAGVDFPNILLSLSARSDNESVPEYKIGIKSRWFWGDVDALLIRLFKGNQNRYLPAGFDSRLLYLLKFMLFWEPGMRYEVFRFNDLCPFIYESYQWIKKSFSRI